MRSTGVIVRETSSAAITHIAAWRAAVVMKSFRTLGPVLCLAASIARLCVLFREIGYAGQAFEMIVRGNKFDIVFSGAGVDDGIGKGELVR